MYKGPAHIISPSPKLSVTLIEQMNADDKSKLFCFSENLIECRRQNEKKNSDTDDMLCKSSC